MSLPSCILWGIAVENDPTSNTRNSSVSGRRSTLFGLLAVVTAVRQRERKCGGNTRPRVKGQAESLKAASDAGLTLQNAIESNGECGDDDDDDDDDDDNDDDKNSTGMSDERFSWH
ncbi:hypothetical protein ANO14919_031630 [Xylariales sp. No.14919]|nr:hypothetical protein ANO14919_031630 [Xylariales sp. No.14919]